MSSAPLRLLMSSTDLLTSQMTQSIIVIILMMTSLSPRLGLTYAASVTSDSTVVAREDRGVTMTLDLHGVQRNWTDVGQRLPSCDTTVADRFQRCPNTTGHVTGNASLNKMAACPWEILTDSDPLRIPRDIHYARCICRYSQGAADHKIIIPEVSFLYQPRAVVGWDRNNRYTISNNQEQQFMFAKESSDCLTRQCCGPCRPFVMDVTDNQGQQLLQFHRPCRCQGMPCWCCHLQQMEIHSPPEVPIGRVEEMLVQLVVIRDISWWSSGILSAGGDQGYYQLVVIRDIISWWGSGILSAGGHRGYYQLVVIRDIISWWGSGILSAGGDQGYQLVVIRDISWW
ncbi:hypothetical protein ACOMHN_040886 [Nucella lapillus]